MLSTFEINLPNLACWSTIGIFFVQPYTVMVSWWSLGSSGLSWIKSYKTSLLLLLPMTDSVVCCHMLYGHITIVDDDDNIDTCLMAIFPDNPGKPIPEWHHSGFYWSKDDWGGGDNWSSMTCKAPVKLLPPANQHPTFLQAGCPSCCPSNSVGALKVESISSWMCSPPAHLGSSNLVFTTVEWDVKLLHVYHTLH